MMKGTISVFYLVEMEKILKTVDFVDAIKRYLEKLLQFKYDS